MVLRAIEHKIEALFEGIFGRAFRTNVQPVELARELDRLHVRAKRPSEDTLEQSFDLVLDSAENHGPGDTPKAPPRRRRVEVVQAAPARPFQLIVLVTFHSEAPPRNR